MKFRIYSVDLDFRVEWTMMGETTAMLGANWRSTLSASTPAGQVEEPPADERGVLQTSHEMPF